MWPCNDFAIRKRVYLQMYRTLMSLPEKRGKKPNNRQCPHSVSSSLYSKAEPQEHPQCHTHNPFCIVFLVFFLSCMHTQTPNPLILLGHPGSSSDITAALYDPHMLQCSLSWEAASVFFNALTFSSSLNCFFHLGP